MYINLINPHRRELTVQLFDNVEGVLNDLLDLFSGFRIALRREESLQLGGQWI